jgi:FkbM family methyltransferase
MAWTLYHAPELERPYAHAAHAARAMPMLHTLFRETTDRLVDRLVHARRHYRRVRVGGVAPLFDISSFTVKGQYFAHVAYEPGATATVLSRLAPGSVFIDIGANTGYFSVLAALQVGLAGRVFAFEPNPAVREQLHHHLEINQIADRVTVSDLAIAERCQDAVPLFVSCWRDNNGISSLTPSAETMASGGLRDDRRIPVRVATFDSWVAHASVPRIDLIKIDVEGAELHVLTGMTGTLASNPPRALICETMPDSAAARRLRDCGYRSSIVDDIPGGIPNLLFERVDE